MFIVHRMLAQFHTICPCGNAVRPGDRMGFSADWDRYHVRCEACRIAAIERYSMTPHDGMLWSTRETVPEDWTRLTPARAVGTADREEACSTSA